MNCEGLLMGPFETLFQNLVWGTQNLPYTQLSIMDSPPFAVAHFETLGGSVVFEALYYKPEGRGFETRSGE
jgi:hypothetical protein